MSRLEAAEALRQVGDEQLLDDALGVARDEPREAELAVEDLLVDA